MMSAKTFYKGKLEGFVYSLSKEKQTPTFEFKFSVGEKKVDGEWVEIPVLTRSVYRYLNEKTAQYFFKDLEAIGFDGDDIATIDDWVEDNRGKVLTLSSHMEPRSDGNGDREVWQFALQGASEPKASDVQGLKQIGKTFNSLWKATKKPSVGTPKPVTVKMTDAEAKELEDIF